MKYNLTPDELAEIHNKRDRICLSCETRAAQNRAFIARLKSIILLAVQNRQTAYKFFIMLDSESMLLGSLVIYQAGKKCFSAKMPPQHGFQKYMKKWNATFDNRVFLRRYRKAYKKLLEQLPNEETRQCMKQLQAVYRETFQVNQHMKDYFMLGYAYAKAREMGTAVQVCGAKNSGVTQTG